MSGLRVLITNNTLAGREGSELYVRDIATGLLERGHSPFAYSTMLGGVADEIRAATIPVVDDLRALSVVPDVIHGHHHLEVMSALLHFPGVPAVCFCHGWIPWEEAAPRFPRIQRYVAVSLACRDRIVFESGVPEDKVRLLLNFVNLARFTPREPLPAQPRKALIFNNNATEANMIGAVRSACATSGIALDVIGRAAGRPVANPESVLKDYDLVFATGRSALEALAVGAAVVLCHPQGAGPMITAADLERIRLLNLGVRATPEPVQADYLAQQIARYDTADAAEVSRVIRATAGRDTAVDQLVELYHEAIAEQKQSATTTDPAEIQAAGRYLQWLAPALKERYQIAGQLNAVIADRERIQAHRDILQIDRDLLQADRDRVDAERVALSAEYSRLCADHEALARSLIPPPRHRSRPVAMLARLGRTLVRFDRPSV